MFYHLLKLTKQKSKFTKSQIVFAVKQSDTGIGVGEFCRKLGISEATFYNRNLSLLTKN